jgi:hypothetical protein
MALYAVSLYFGYTAVAKQFGVTGVAYYGGILVIAACVFCPFKTLRFLCYVLTLVGFAVTIAPLCPGYWETAWVGIVLLTVSSLFRDGAESTKRGRQKYDARMARNDAELEYLQATRGMSGPESFRYMLAQRKAKSGA